MNIWGSLTSYERTISGGSVFNFLKEEVINLLSISGLEGMKDLDQALNAVIAQALTTGDLRNTPGKAHIFLLGPPGSGKKLVSKAASILNPVFDEAQSGKVSVSGLVGYSKLTENGWESSPGSLPRCHRGAFSIQDWHSVPATKRDEIVDVLAKLMEDGRVINSTAGGAGYPSEVGIIIDGNRNSDIKMNRSLKNDVVGDISIPTHLLSRIDFCCEFSKETPDRFNASLKTYESASVPFTKEERKNYSNRVRRLKLIVALLNRENCSVSIPKDVQEHMVSLHNKLFERNQGNLEKIKSINDYHFRTANAICRFAMAYARSRNSTEMSTDDVENAFSLIATKYKFLKKTVIPGLKTVPMWTNQRAAIRAHVLSKFSRKTLPITKLCTLLAKDLSIEVTNAPAWRTKVNRVLKDVGAQPVQGKRGYWKIP